MKLVVEGKSVVQEAGSLTVLQNVPFSQWSRSPSSKDDIVLGFAAGSAVHMVDIKLGQVACSRYLSCARKKLWWMIPEWGTSMSTLPTETQFLLLEHQRGGPYTIMLPLLDGSFRATLKADRNRRLKAVSEDLVLRIESGDPSVKADAWSSALLVASGRNLFELVQRGVTTAARLSGEARPLSEKRVPESLDYFGWCTWDAFYSSVSAQGVQAGLRSLHEGGIKPGTVIIDDGWQMTEVDDEYSEAMPTKVLRRMRMPATETIDDEFEEAEKAVLASYADALAGGTDLMNSMPALADSDYGEALRQSQRSRDGEGDVDEKMEALLVKLEEIKIKTRLQVPQIERTILKLSKTPKEMALWSRLVNRVAGWLLGLLQVFFLLFYQGIVDPAGPFSWPVALFRYLATGPLKGNMLTFYKASGDFTRRIISVKANGKFARPDAHHDNRHWFAEAIDFKSVTTALRADFGVRFIYCWHGLPAYWGGVMPGGDELDAFAPRIVYPQPTAGLREIEPAMLWNPAVLAGIGIVEDSAGLYQSMHRYLAAAGVDGVKVDCQAGLGLVGTVAGGGAALARKYHGALEESIAAHLPGNHAINCMCHSTENIYGARDTAIMRASDDYYPREPASSTPHVAACAYNSLFISALCQPDWDMFQSLHPSAHMHAVARAVSGGAVYVSDKVGKHDFAVLRKLVLRDGSVLRALRPGLPTADCVFEDPLRDGTSLLKVWTNNACNGVVGVFHLQGSFWDRVRRRFTTAVANPAPLTTEVYVRDIESMGDVLGRLPTAASGRYAVLSSVTGCLTVVDGADASVTVSVAASDADVLTVAPTVRGTGGAEFAPLGLGNMFNAGGAVGAWKTRGKDGENGAGALQHEVTVRGEGTFVAYSSALPAQVLVDGAAAVHGTVAWDQADGKLSVHVGAKDEAAPIEHVLKFAF